VALGDDPSDAALQAGWHEFCDRLRAAGDLVFKDTNPANPLQRADGFRYLTQNLAQSFDLALETKDTRYPMIHAFCAPDRKLGGDNADFVYLQAWIDGASEYRITGRKGTARFFNITVQGPRPATDVYYGTDHPNLHEPFGDTPEANITGDQIVTDDDGTFVLHIGGDERPTNWLPTTPGSRKLFLRQGFDSWDEEAAELSIARVGMDEPRPMPTPDVVLESMRWAGDFLTGAMAEWPDRELEIGARFGEGEVNAMPPPRFAGTAEERDRHRGRLLVTMPWRLRPDESLVIEFEATDSFWMFTNMGAFWNSMDYLYRPVSATPSRSAVDGDGRVRIVMAHADTGHHNWLDTQGFAEGYLSFRNIGTREFPPISTTVVPVVDLAAHLPADTRIVTPAQRRDQMHARFDAIRRRYRR
jgi:hypothetical protein